MEKRALLPFQDIKLATSIEQIMQFTGLRFKKIPSGYRCECPVHQGGPGSLSISLDELDEKRDPGVFGCWSSPKATKDKPDGGDRIAFLAHVRDIGQYEAHKIVAEAFAPHLLPQRSSPQQSAPPSTVPEEKRELPKKEEGSPQERGFRELPYLEADHPAVTALTIPPEVCEAAGIGFAPRGWHRDGVAVPIRKRDGTLITYVSISADGRVKLPPKWTL